MKGMTRVALMLALAAVTAAPATAAEPEARNDTEIYVVNNHLADVRVFAEDAEGRLHSLGRVARGQLRTMEVPEEIAGQDYRIKVFPATPVWSPIPDDFGIKTKRAERFLRAGKKVKVTIFFRYRQLRRPELGVQILDDVTKALLPIADIESRSGLEGRQMTMIVAPSATKIAEAKAAAEAESQAEAEPAAEASA